MVYNNTIDAAGMGIVFDSTAAQGSAVVGNVMFATTAITGAVATHRNNVVDSVANAAMHVVTASGTLGMMDFYPSARHYQGRAALDFTMFAMDRDFNCTPEAGRAFRGAYAGEGASPGWRIASERQPVGVGCGGPSGGDARVAPRRWTPPSCRRWRTADRTPTPRPGGRQRHRVGRTWRVGVFDRRSAAQGAPRGVGPSSSRGAGSAATTWRARPAKASSPRRRT